MHVLITGGAGFLGVRLARALLGGTAMVGGQPAAALRLTLLDRQAPPADLATHPQVQLHLGDLPALLQADAAAALPPDTAAVVHLAAAVSGECEADLALGLHANLDATRALLLAAGALPRPPVFVFSSSLAVYGAPPGQALPEEIDDDTLPLPQSSYGTQKLMCEQLLADCSRRGLVRGRSLRLMTVAVRPGRPNAAASGFLSGIVREPLAGQRARCPVPPDTPVALNSPGAAVRGLLRALQVDDGTWGPPTAVNLPALSTTPAALVDALARAGGAALRELVDWHPDAAVARIVAGWPARFRARRAWRLGLQADASADSLVQAYLDELHDAACGAPDRSRERT